MSGQFRLTPRAYREMTAIGRYTRKTWGAAQRDAYLADLDRRFQWLADHPQLGRKRDEIEEGLRSFLQGAHLVFYVVLEDRIDIVGLPHQSMDLESYFGLH